MMLKQKTNFIVGTQIDHLHQMRTLSVLLQGKQYYYSICLTKKVEFPSNINKMLYYFIARVKMLLAYQEKKRVNPHSQLCAHNSRFRPS